MSERTPGPWITRNNGHGGTAVEGPQGVVYNLIEGDARLIAAAPDMLAALKDCRDVLGIRKDFFPLGPAVVLGKVILDAIAKAEGK